MKLKYINIHAEGPSDRGPKVDVFAYGQMLYELLAKEKIVETVPSVRTQLNEEFTGQVGQLNEELEGQDFHQKFVDDPSYNIKDGKKLYRIAKECTKVIKKRPKITTVVKRFKKLEVGKWLDC